MISGESFICSLQISQEKSGPRCYSSCFYYSFSLANSVILFFSRAISHIAALKKTELRVQKARSSREMWDIQRVVSFLRLTHCTALLCDFPYFKLSHCATFFAQAVGSSYISWTWPGAHFCTASCSTRLFPASHPTWWGRIRTYILATHDISEQRRNLIPKMIHKLMQSEVTENNRTHSKNWLTHKLHFVSTTHVGVLLQRNSWLHWYC